MRKRMKAHDEVTGGDLLKAYPKKRVEQLIRDALKRLKVKGTNVSQENRQLILSAFGSLRQKQGSQRPVQSGSVQGPRDPVP